MPLLATADYRPDVSDYEGQATRNILNVIPRGDGYGPFPGFSAYTSALPATCRGAFYALKTAPWEAAQPMLQGILSQIGTGLNTTGLTAAETGALNQLSQNASQGNPFASQSMVMPTAS
jgi:hypothetical protein